MPCFPLTLASVAAFTIVDAPDNCILGQRLAAARLGQHAPASAALWKGGHAPPSRHCVQVYEVFGLQYRMALSTRPEKYMGDLALWAKAEAALEEALNASGQHWEVRLWAGSPVGKKLQPLPVATTAALELARI